MGHAKLFGGIFTDETILSSMFNNPKKKLCESP